MKNILIGNGINIQYDKKNYTTKSIILRMLTELDNKDYPCDYIVNEPLLIKNYIGKLFLTARDILDGKFDSLTTCEEERISLKDFKERYGAQKNSLRIADIGFEDYYLIHDLLCHKKKLHNPEQFTIREALKMAYFHSIYNHGNLNLLHQKYESGLINFLMTFNNIFTTNYDNNLEIATKMKIYHLHGQFDKLSETYNPESFRNQLNDNPLDGIPNDPQYQYLHSTAISTYCGDYKQYQMNVNTQANEAMKKMTIGYQASDCLKKDIDTWKNSDNQLIVNMYQALKLKISNPTLHFQEDYSIKEFQEIAGELTIFGLSPYNDYHLFEMINNNTKLEKCIFYYYSDKERQRIEQLLSHFYEKGTLIFENVKKFWEVL